MNSSFQNKLQQAEDQLQALGSTYEAALAARAIPESLYTEIQAYARLVRSLLDDCAKEMHRVAAPDQKPEESGEAVRYPIDGNAPGFLRTVRAAFPGLTEQHPELLRLMMDAQPFVDAASWLAVLDRLTQADEPPVLHPHTADGYSLSLMTFHGDEMEFASPASRESAASKAAWVGLALEAGGNDLLDVLAAIQDGARSKAEAVSRYQAQLDANA
ncbi:hypothetical protein [Gorillibacterium sp. CAU 1737]|uniref:hypothetical protein n=1 Tax=Gorillibacterium sp. CAU 1737 TaxID=3140362 RepID=UPI003260327F